MVGKKNCGPLGCGERGLVQAGVRSSSQCCLPWSTRARWGSAAASPTACRVGWSHSWSTVLGEEGHGTPYSCFPSQFLASRASCKQFPLFFQVKKRNCLPCSKPEVPLGSFHLATAFSSCPSAEMRKKDLGLTGIDPNLSFLTSAPPAARTGVVWAHLCPAPLPGKVLAVLCVLRGLIHESQARSEWELSESLEQTKTRVT